MLKNLTYSLSYSEKRIQGDLFFSTPNEVEKVILFVIQGTHGSNLGKTIGKCEIDCKGLSKVSYFFEINPIFTKANAFFSPKLKEVHELIQVEGAFYELDIICKTGEEHQRITMPVRLGP